MAGGLRFALIVVWTSTNAGGRLGYTSKTNRISKVLDFDQLGGLDVTHRRIQWVQ